MQMKISTATVETGNASSYLRKLCQHWSHKFPVSFDAQHGTIDLAVGKCILDADESTLTVQVEVHGDDDEVRLQNVVEGHIKRFAFRETLVFAWNPQAA